MKDENRLNMVQEKKPSLFKRVLLVLLVTFMLLLTGLYGAMFVLFRGPFVHAAAAYAQSAGTTPVGKITMGLFLSEKEQERLMTIDPGTGIAEGEEKTFSVYPRLGGTYE